MLKLTIKTNTYIDPQELDGDDIIKIEIMLAYMLAERPIVEYIENTLFNDLDDATERFQVFLDTTYTDKHYNACEFILDVCKQDEFELLSKDQFLELTTAEQAKYLNDLAFYLDTDAYPLYEKDGKYYETCTDVEIDDLFDFALELNYNDGELYKKVFNQLRGT